MLGSHFGGPRRTVAVVLLGTTWALSAMAAPGATCRVCGWAPPRTRGNITVRTASELMEAARQARPETTILLEDGIYRLDRMLDLAAPGLVVRGKHGNRARVVIRGEGMRERQVGVALSVSAPRVVLADFTVGFVRLHGVQVRGERGAEDVVLHNLRIVDTGQQLIKGSLGQDGSAADRGLVACSTLEYTNHAPSDYTNGVDVLGGEGWVVRDNYILRVRGPANQGWKAGPAVLFWVRARDTRVEGNLVLDCYRGIALGLGPDTPGSSRGGAEPFDHFGGVIRRNVVCNLNPWADEGIEANGVPGVRIEHNTVLVEGSLPWSISVRFPASRGTVRNNLTNRPIVTRDGGRAELRGNITDAQRSWFVNPARGDLRLARGNLAAVDAGVPIADEHRGPAREPGFAGKAPDTGAFEYTKTSERSDDRSPM